MILLFQGQFCLLLLLLWWEEVDHRSCQAFGDGGGARGGGVPRAALSGGMGRGISLVLMIELVKLGGT